MDKKLESKLTLIVNRLLQDDIKSFKIGKSKNAENRFDDDDYKTCHLFSIVATGNSNIINQAEKDLINYFRKHKTLGGKCLNRNVGGGNPDATEVYFAAQLQNADYNDHLVDPKQLFNFNPVEL